MHVIYLCTHLSRRCCCADDRSRAPRVSLSGCVCAPANENSFSGLKYASNPESRTNLACASTYKRMNVLQSCGTWLTLATFLGDWNLYAGFEVEFQRLSYCRRRDRIEPRPFSSPPPLRLCEEHVSQKKRVLYHGLRGRTWAYEHLWVRLGSQSACMLPGIPGALEANAFEGISLSDPEIRDRQASEQCSSREHQGSDNAHCCQ